MGKKRKLESVGDSLKFPATRDGENGQTKNAEKGNRTKADHSLSSNDNVPTRNTDRLYASQVTLNCTLNNNCVPCAYKIGCFDVALDKEFCKATPNQRPEQCPRSQRKSQEDTNSYGVMGFRSEMSILTVGDGDFSFSLGLARKLMQASGLNQSKGEKTFLVATSYESESTLRKVYPDFDQTLCELGDLGVHVAYNVDATQILETLKLRGKASKKNLQRRFHRICWNFPCTAIASGQDGQNKAMEENKDLVRSFVESSRSVLTDRGDGELYVCHKTKPPYNQWNLEQVALERQKRDAKNNSSSIVSRPLLYYSGRIVLDRFLIPPYTPRKALDKKSFPCHDACFYIFAQDPTTVDQSSGETAKKLFSSTIPQDHKDCVENTTVAPASIALAKIDPERIRIIRRKHMEKNGLGKTRKRTKKSHRGKGDTPWKQF